MHSETLDLLSAALVKAQAEFTAIPKDSTNPFFKSSYAGLPIVVEKAAPILSKHGLVISQHISYTDDIDTMYTYLLHASGQYIVHAMKLHLTKQDAQGQGSAVTYARRYSYMAVLGLVADDDDDGNAASKAPSKDARVAGVQEAKQALNKRAPASDPAEAPAPKATGAKIQVASDHRWPVIVEAQAADQSNDFVNSIVEQGKKWGTLTEKQLANGNNQARKLLDNAPRAKDIISVAEVADTFGISDAPF